MVLVFGFSEIHLHEPKKKEKKKKLQPNVSIVNRTVDQAINKVAI